MAKVTVILGPPASGKSQEVERIIAGRPVTRLGSMLPFGVKRDPFYLSRLLLDDAKRGSRVAVIEEAVADIRETLIAAVISGLPMDLVISSSSIKYSDIESFSPYLDIINLWKK